MLDGTWEWIGQNKDSLSVVVGVIGVIFLVSQITQSARQERHRLRRRQLAARATLPLALSGISDYARRVVVTLLAVNSARGPQTANEVAAHRPQTPADLIGSIERMIEASLKPRVAQRLSEIVSEVQVLQSRMSSVVEDTRGVPQNLEDYLIQAATIDALAASLFDYARQDTEDVAEDAISAADILSAMNRMKLYNVKFAEMRARVTSRQRRGAPVSLSAKMHDAWVRLRLRFAKPIKTDC